MSAQDPSASPHRTDRRRGRRIRVAPGIYQHEHDGDPNRYLISWQADGKTQWEVFYDSLAKAKRERERKRVNTREGELVPRTNMTVAAVAEELLTQVEARVRRGERSSRTLEEYRSHWKNHLEGELGRRRIQSITSADISRLVTRLRAKKKVVNGKQADELLADWTLHNITKVLRSVFKYAYRHGYIAADPVARRFCAAR